MLEENMKIELAAFDLDGTLGNTIPTCVEALRRAASPYAGHTLSDGEITRDFGINETGIIKNMVPEHWQEALDDYHREYAVLQAKAGGAFEGIKELLYALRAHGTRVALVTGKGEISCKITLECLELGGCFDDVLTGGEQENIKAHSLGKLAEKYGLDPSQCVYVGDAVSDVEQARKAGMNCLSALWAGTVDREELRKVNPDFLFNTVGELKGYLLAHV